MQRFKQLILHFYHFKQKLVMVLMSTFCLHIDVYIKNIAELRNVIVIALLLKVRVLLNIFLKDTVLGI